MPGKNFSYTTTIRESHLDAFGHVNNAKYLELFEEARWEMGTKNGFGMDVVLAMQQGPIILAIQIKFQRELRLREAITIETTCIAYRKRIGTLQQRIVNAQGEVCTTAEFTFGLFDMKARSLITPTPRWLQAIGVDEDTLSNN